MSGTAQLDKSQNSSPARAPLRLSVVICTKDRPESLAQTLETLWRQTRLPDELVIVDDGRLAPELVATITAAASMRGVRFSYCNKSDRPGLARSRKAGIAQSSGDIILFLDDDVLLDANYIAGIMKVYESDADHRIGGVEGVLQGLRYHPLQMLLLRFFGMDSPRREGQILKNFIGVLVRNIPAPTDVQWLTGCNMSYRREALDGVEIPTDLEGWSAGEDRALSWQVGRRWHLVATPDARLVHCKAPTARLSARQTGFQEVYYNYLHFRRFMPQDLAHRAAFGWLAFGYVVVNLLRRDWQRAVGNLSAIGKIIKPGKKSSEHSDQSDRYAG
ncbi:MAG: glycosyltransferase [Candidatus Sumerlaeia bacterium]|nr:glycosyltransferase [Candidatus Sumerlaeia bacterium]